MDENQPGQPETPEEKLRRLEAEAEALRRDLEAAKPEEEPPAPEAELEDPPLPAPAVAVDEATLEKVEKLLQRYRLEASRGNREMAAPYLKEAQALGPGTSLVLEILGDDAVERRQLKEAVGYYARAKDALPKSVSAEKKHADLVFRTSALSAGMLGVSEFENVASAKGASVLSAILPGAGQMASGEIARGLGYLLVWAGSIVWAVLTPNGFQGLIAMVSGKSEPPLNALVFVPVFLAFVTWLASLIDMNSRAKLLSRNLEKGPPPKPPVDLPY